MTMKKISVTLLFVTLLGFLFYAGYSDKSTYIIDDTSVADGDTIVSGWIDIGSASNVAYTLIVNDSVSARANAFYRFGGTERVAIGALDSISAIRRASTTGISVGKNLRGYGTHINDGVVSRDTNLIPGMNQIQVKVTVHDVATDGSPGANRVRVGLITSE